ncbi:MAG TPA: alpha/beta fold hydrolase [Phenylobacterium sp.]|uniref:alpha/beta fold hydrolase n=1 Tax=Phenylobacterium sp. TaxID=1871053 RepID=UPI002B4961CC|nr:alpha/beta fold hydrolase [Phenylobacterium sp.]HKR88170.1 alpha/beta fold hydrolase [Phenylobacterium sp.]
MDPIVMVHGAFVGGWSFERFRAPFEAAGHRVLTPDLRGHGAREPSDAVVGVSIRDYANDVAALCASLPSRPILIGHSMGGLVAQLAARRVKPRAVVLLAPSPPWGLVGWNVEEALTAFGAQFVSLLSNGAVEPSAEVMRTVTLNRMTRAEAAPILARLRRESARAVRETLNWWLDPFMTSSIGSGPLRARSLVISGEADQVHPPASGRLVAERIGGEFLCLPEMSHWLPGEPGWEDVAEAALEFIGREARAAA